MVIITLFFVYFDTAFLVVAVALTRHAFAPEVFAPNQMRTVSTSDANPSRNFNYTRLE
jgi:hypothetical protein